MDYTWHKLFGKALMDTCYHMLKCTNIIIKSDTKLHLSSVAAWPGFGPKHSTLKRGQCSPSHSRVLLLCHIWFTPTMQELHLWNSIRVLQERQVSVSRQSLRAQPIIMSEWGIWGREQEWRLFQTSDWWQFALSEAGLWFTANGHKLFPYAPRVEPSDGGGIRVALLASHIFLWVGLWVSLTIRLLSCHHGVVLER